MPEMKTLTVNGVQYELPFAPASDVKKTAFSIPKNETAIINFSGTANVMIYCRAWTSGVSAVISYSGYAAGDIRQNLSVLSNGGQVSCVVLPESRGQGLAIKCSRTDTTIDVCIDGELQNNPPTVTFTTESIDGLSTAESFAPASHAHTEYAPTGYGLGTVGADVTDANHVFDVFRNGWFRTFSTTENTAVSHGAGIALVYDANRALHLLAKTTAGTMRTRYTPNSDGVFVEDLINPPMTAGYEYRTIERWSSKTVYVKVVDFGALPNNTYKAVAHGSTLTKCLRYNLVNKHSSLMLDGHRNILVNVDATNIQITTNTDLSAHQAWCVIWYTKD